MKRSIVLLVLLVAGCGKAQTEDLPKCENVSTATWRLFPDLLWVSSNLDASEIVDYRKRIGFYRKWAINIQDRCQRREILEVLDFAQRKTDEAEYANNHQLPKPPMFDEKRAAEDAKKP